MSLPALGGGVEAQWQVLQQEMQARVITHDVLDFDTRTFENLRYIGGVDISWDRHNAHRACATLVVCEFPAMRVVHEETKLFEIALPYIPGFLGFRESPPLLELLETLRASTPHLYPQVVLTDGNGLLHPRACGVACHMGVMADTPMIGVAKTLLNVDGLSKGSVMRVAAQALRSSGDWFELKGSSGRVLGAAVLARDASEGQAERKRARLLKRASPSACVLPTEGATDRAEPHSAPERPLRIKQVHVSSGLLVASSEGGVEGQGPDGAALNNHARRVHDGQQRATEGESSAGAGGGESEEGAGEVEGELAGNCVGGVGGGGAGGKPVFVSVGHRVSLDTAIR